jgi:hypothetical protein
MRDAVQHRDTDITRLNVPVSRPIHAALGTAAAADDRSVTSWCRVALKAALKQRGYNVDEAA